MVRKNEINNNRKYNHNNHKMNKKALYKAIFGAWEFSYINYYMEFFHFQEMAPKYYKKLKSEKKSIGQTIHPKNSYLRFLYHANVNFY